ncbi:MAG: SPOR domain-containing protein [Sphingomonadaceae bacterium]|nr:SPOR domain-containing protein [Sphingomonadaceae bacterium]
MTSTDTSDGDSNRFALDDPDRLPWLETADGYEYDDGASPLKVAAMVLGGLALLAAIVGLIYWAQRSNDRGATGNGELIAAQEGDYKVKPDEAGGKTFEGEGDSAFAASEGKKTDATIAPPAKAGDTKVASPAPAKVAVSGPTPAGAVMVQLGAFGDSAKADAAWAGLTKRFGFLSGTNRKIAEATVEGGRKVFRLQAVTASAAAAQQLCAKLKAAGENCLIVR